MAANVTPWETITSTFTFRNKDAEFWWDRAGRLFATFLEQANYTLAEQYRELQFFALFVTPQMGPAPDETMPWERLRMPDQTPIDFSWDWKTEESAILRYAFEPIVTRGAQANNLRNPTAVWLDTMMTQGLIPGLDLQWYASASPFLKKRGTDM